MTIVMPDLFRHLLLNNSRAREGLFFILLRMRIILLCIALLIAPCLAQEPNVTAPVDSAAYYDSLADYNYKKYRSDQTLADVFFWVGVGTTISAPILAFAAVGVADCYGYEGCQDGNLALNIAALTTLALVPLSWIAYGGFSAMKLMRHRNFDKYYWKKEKLKNRRELEKNESANLQVQVLPFLNPLDGRYGAALALSF